MCIKCKEESGNGKSIPSSRSVKRTSVNANFRTGHTPPLQVQRPGPIANTTPCAKTSWCDNFQDNPHVSHLIIHILLRLYFPPNATAPHPPHHWHAPSHPILPCTRGASRLPTRASRAAPSWWQYGRPRLGPPPFTRNGST